MEDSKKPKQMILVLLGPTYLLDPVCTLASYLQNKNVRFDEKE